MEAAAAVEPYAALLGRPVPEVIQDLESFCSLLTKWQRVQNLVSRETLDAFWERHVADSLQLLPLLRSDDRHCVDIGSGGGLPAIPLAIAAKGTTRHFTLTESNGRKTSFLRAVVRELGLSVAVQDGRAGQSESTSADVITARAVAPLETLLGYAAPYFGPTTRALLHKGREYQDEVLASKLLWSYEVETVPSRVDPASVLLVITKLRRNG